MKFTYSWLKEHLDTQASPQEISDALTNLGLVVDAMTNPSKGLEKLVIAEIVSAEPHPDANKLKVCQARLSVASSQTTQIVCGDPKVAAGMRVVLARPGQQIPSNGMVIKEAKVRGVESNGMFCSLAELNLAESSDGIINLPDDAPVGESYAAYAGLDDPVYDVDITPNRGDCLGVYGIARDLAATGIGSLKSYDVPNGLTVFKSAQVLKNAVGGEELPVFMLREIRGVKNGPSPQWLQDRLRAIGLRPRSILVDITNYMAYAYGRPMHVFDADAISGDMTIRFAKDGEVFGALDDKEHTLTSEMLVVSDPEKVVGLAGIMGSKNSGATDETTNVLLEAAVFNTSRIAKTGRQLGIVSDARYRLERGVDIEVVAPMIEIATKMILDLCGGEASDIISTPHEKATASHILFDPKEVKTLGGLCIERARIIKILSALGFVCDDQNGLIDVTVPTWRHDIEGPHDLVEEVCRVVGYDHITLEVLPQMPVNNALMPEVESKIKMRDIARRHLSSRGLVEVNTWSFLDEKRAYAFGYSDDDKRMKLLNPISQDLGIMRPELLANLVVSVGRNADRGLLNTAVFEIGSVFSQKHKDLQENRIAGVRAHKKSDRHWLEASRDVDLYDARADLMSLISALGLDETKVQIKADGPSWYHPGRVASVYLGPKNCLGTFGEIHPEILEDFDIDGVVVGFELRLDALPMKVQKAAKKPLEISALLPLHRDLAFIAPDHVAVEGIVQAARKSDPRVVKNVEVFDVYVGKGVPEGHKSIALCVTFEQNEKTLNDDEINALMDQVIVAVGRETGAELRS